MGVGYGAAGGVTAGLGIAAIYAVANRAWIQFRINRALQAHTSYRFQELALNQAVLIYASYMGDTLTMAEALSLEGNDEFVAQPGITQAIAELYFGDASPESMAKLEALVGL